MLDEGPNGSRRSFRTKCQGCPVPILEGVHFFFDDVGRGADAPGEQGRDFEDGDPDFIEAIGGRPASGGVFNQAPAGRLFGQYIFDAFNALDHGHDTE
jgi:hypothetical protein